MTRRLVPIFCAVCIAWGVLTPQGVFAAENQPSQVDSSTHSQKNKSTAAHSGDRKKHAVKKGKNQQGKGVHASEWVFNEGKRSSDAWRNGVPANTLQKKAVGEQAEKNKSVNTESGINSALNAAGEDRRQKGGMGVSVGQQSSSWREATPAAHEAPDENLPMESRHVVRAYADMATSDDMSISVGPELTLKNEQRERATSNKQPDSTLGMGMQFKVDF